MHTAIKMPLRSLNPLVVKELQEKYPEYEIYSNEEGWKMND